MTVIHNERSVLVIDDQALFADALAKAIEGEPQISWAGTAHSIDEALASPDDPDTGAPTPDVLLIDLAHLEREGVARTRGLLEQHGETRLLILTAQEPSAEHLYAAVEAGATGLLSKTSRLDALVEAIGGATSDTMIVDRSYLARGMSSRDDGPSHPGSSHSLLTHREQELLEMLAAGTDVQAAANQLGLSVHTCRGHVKNLLQKLGVHSQLEAVAAARRMGLLGSN